MWKQDIYFSLNSVAWDINSVLSVCPWPDAKLPQCPVGSEWSHWLGRQKHLNTLDVVENTRLILIPERFLCGAFMYVKDTCACVRCDRQQRYELHGHYNETVNTCCTVLMCKIISHHSSWHYLFFFFSLYYCNFRFCVGDKFFLKNNMILCQTDYEEGLMKEGYAPQVRWSDATSLRIQSTMFFYLFCSTCI